MIEQRLRLELKKNTPDSLYKITKEFPGVSKATINKIAKKIFLKEELYKGPYIDLAPDLVILSNVGYDLKGKVNSHSVFDRTNLVGMHTQHDAFFFSSGSIPCKSIFDAKDAILGFL